MFVNNSCRQSQDEKGQEVIPAYLTDKAAFGSLFFLDNLGCARHNAQANLAFCSHLHEIPELMRKHAQKENGLHGLLEIMIQSMMVAEREEFLSENRGNNGKGFRPGHTYGHGRRL